MTAGMGIYDAMQVCLSHIHVSEKERAYFSLAKSIVLLVMKSFCMTSKLLSSHTKSLSR